MIEIPGVQFIRRFPARAFLFSPAALWLYGRDDGSGDFVLDGECVFQFVFVSFRPDMISRRAIDELGGNPHAVSRLAHVVFQHIAHTQFRGDLPYLGKLALVSNTRIARGHENHLMQDNSMMMSSLMTSDNIPAPGHRRNYRMAIPRWTACRAA